MTDIVTSLRTWVHAVDAAPASDLMDEAADEIGRLRGDAEVARLRLEAAQADIARLRLTDAEREAVRFFSLIDGPHNVPVANKRAATLRGLLERMK
jgi:hypothetical protein